MYICTNKIKSSLHRFVCLFVWNGVDWKQLNDITANNTFRERSVINSAIQFI